MSMAECKQAVLVEKETAHRDCLTGCYDKMTIQYLVDLCFLKSDVRQSHAMFVIDVDNFKRVNDTWGHLAGDRLRRDFASLLRETMPPTAKLYRYGGDEFIAALHEVSLSDVKKCQQKLEQRIARYNEENEIHLSAAWGHAFFNPETDHGLSEIVKRADGMLYAMKRAMKQAAENAS